MRILQVTEAAGGGLLGVVQTLAAGLAGAGHEVAVAYGRRPETPARLDAIAPGIETIELPWGRRTLASELTAGRALRRLVEDWRPDVVHLHSSFAGFVGTLAIGRRCPTVYSPHAYAFAGADRHPLARLAYRGAEWITARRCSLIGAVSDAEAALAREALEAPRVVTVHNGIVELDPDAPPVNATRGTRLVVGMGRILPQKRPRESAQILSALADVAEVAWVGAAPDGDARAFESAGVPVTGWLDHDAAREHLARATVYVHWSGWDGQSLAILEALARDVVVVASDIPANREILGDRAVCADPAEAVALARAVLEDPGTRAAMLAEQRARRGHWSACRMVSDWTAVYERLATADSTAPTDLPTAAAFGPKIGVPWN